MDSMCALASASRCPRQRFQAAKAPCFCVCLRSRSAAVWSSLATLYLRARAGVGQQVGTAPWR